MDNQRLGDLVEIQRLKSRYFRFLDTKDWVNLRGVFTDDLIFYQETALLPTSTTPKLVGGDAFVEYVSQVLATSVTVHHGHMPDIDFTGPDSASGVWAMFDWVDDKPRDYGIQGFGHYHEKYERGPDGIWRIKELRLTRIRVDNVDTTEPTSERPWPAPWVAKKER